MKFLLSSLLLFLVAVAHAASSTGSRLLTVWEDVEDRKLYSKFVGDLEKRGYTISHATPRQEDLRLEYLGERTYDHVIIFPTKAKGLGPNLTAKLLLDFLNAGGNILLALSATQPVPSALNALLLELDIQIPAERTGLVVDHFNYDADTAADHHDVVLVPTPGRYRPGTKNYFGSGGRSDLIAVPRAVGLTLGGGPLLTPILRAPRTAYAYSQKDQAEAADEVFAAGDQLSLVSAFQALNSARLTVAASAEMFQDRWFDARVRRPGAGAGEAVRAWNEQFARRVTGWTFQEIGRLRVNYVEHHLAEAGPLSNVSNPAIYRVNNNVTYEISLSEWVWDRWFAFKVPEDDELQLEFSLLSPLHRLRLDEVAAPAGSGSESEGVYRVTFVVPDHHGVFNFLTDYRRPFLTGVEEKRPVTVRHLAHDEFPFSYEIPAAWPYLAGIGVTGLGWLAFVAVWIFNRPVRQAGDAKKKQ